jgi:bifunctional DNase/RNase
MAKFVEMQVDSIRVHMPSGQHVVILKEKETERYLPIWIGIYEANAIALKITGITPERPTRTTCWPIFCRARRCASRRSR